MLTIDFETYYDKDYSLTKLTTEQYIRSPLFEVIGVGVKQDQEPAVWFSGNTVQTIDFLRELDIPNQQVLAHNAAFDAAILNWRFDLRPRVLLDTLSMARPITGLTVGGSLKALAQKFCLGEKGDEVRNALGKRRHDFTPEELAQYGEYCKNDVDLTYVLFHVLRQFSTPQEMFIIDMMLRMFTEPVLELDKATLQSHLAKVKAKKAKLLATLGGLGVAELMSNDKFAELLRQQGVEPPTKNSPAALKRGEIKPVFAFAKTDPEMKALAGHPNDAVQALAAARLGVKSTLEETRTEAFIGISGRGPLPIMLNYYGAHTGRASGGDRVNLQNLPRGGALRQAIMAPPGHVVVAGDSSQIEARKVAWLAGQDDLIRDFANREDIYSKFASDIYGRPIDRKRKELKAGKEVYPDFVEGFVGKTCLAEDTLVVTNRGTIPIVQVNKTDLLWDGTEWVKHGGVLSLGRKQVLTHAGLSATPDHEILTERGWQEWRAVLTDPSLLVSALSLASLPCSGGSSTRSSTSPFVGAVAAGKASSTETTCAGGGLQGATSALSGPPRRSGTGNTKTQCQTTNTVADCSIGWLPPLLGAIPRLVRRTLATAGAAFRYTRSGAWTGLRSCGMWQPCRGGITPLSTWTASTTTGTMNPATSGLSAGAQTPATSAESTNSKPAYESWKSVYDVTNAGPRHRFTVITEAGPLIVHNCILGLGYGMGPDKFQLTLRNGQVPVEMDLAECQRIVDLYRGKYSEIRKLWKAADKALMSMVRGYEATFGVGISLRCTPEGIVLPNSMLVRYPGLHLRDNKVAYTSRKQVTFIYGAKIVENVVQALARIVVFNQMAKLEQHFRAIRDGQLRRVVLTVHDEIVAVVPEAEAETTKALMETIMSTPPKWATGLPVACEVGYGLTYGDCK